MKSKEELNALKEEVETLNKKIAELTEEELAQVFGGSGKFACEVPFYKPTLEWIEYSVPKNDPQE